VFQRMPDWQGGGQFAGSIQRREHKQVAGQQRGGESRQTATGPRSDVLLLRVLGFGDANLLAHLTIAFALWDLLERDSEAAVPDVPVGLMCFGNSLEAQPRDSCKLHGQQDDQQMSEQPHGWRL
jgi:hypothetical protein